MTGIPEATGLVADDIDGSPPATSAHAVCGATPAVPGAPAAFPVVMRVVGRCVPVDWWPLQEASCRALGHA